MAPRIPLRPTADDAIPSSDDATEVRGAEEEEFHTEESDLADDDGLQEEQLEPEYHTEGSDDDEKPGERSQPYLPKHLLATTAKPAPRTSKDVPWDQLTPKQKRNRKRKAQLAKTKMLKRLENEAEASGVLQAGDIAQAKRRVPPNPSSQRVKSGRVEKKTQPIVSGRQRMLESRIGQIASTTALAKSSRSKRRKAKARKDK
ncbi:hypothetical protein B0A50_04760 [Salinomyces thailandicus]|uniref:Uncharacterized protein n=1 Tax=Salinomyces thailandicus TaxID=706561 RepID=A0A4U0TX92_9PEZI|nr:hypothetical protein B0A50_04760 [Salinomyces thailandica]